MGCTQIQEAQKINQEGTLKTTDNIEIAYTYTKVQGTEAVILLHMLDSNKESYKLLTEYLTENEITTIAIDFRGHGKSQGNWKEYTETDFQKMIMDVNAAKIFLINNGFTDISIIGASIGANLALKYATIDKDINKIILISPAENYKSITTLDALNKVNANLLLVAAHDDKSSEEAVEKIYAQYGREKQKEIFDIGGHGTNLLNSQPEIKNKILKFLKNPD